MRRLRFFRCQTSFGLYESKSGLVQENCGYEGKPEKALKPRPSRKPVYICPSCLSEVK